MAEQDPLLCSTCFQSISLQDCEFDEDKRPVHAKCYAEKGLFGPPSAGLPAAGVARHMPAWRKVGQGIKKIVRRKPR